MTELEGTSFTWRGPVLADGIIYMELKVGKLSDGFCKNAKTIRVLTGPGSDYVKAENTKAGECRTFVVETDSLGLNHVGVMTFPMDTEGRIRELSVCKKMTMSGAIV